MAQILSITCDNASNNDTMIEALKDRLEIFPGESNRTRCFDHIVNLVAKSIIQQFDVPKAKANESFDDVLRELMVSAEDLDKEELATREGERSESEGDEDDTDGWVDEREEMSESERKDLDDNIQPIRRVLVKVSVVFVARSMLNNPGCSSARQRMPSRIPQPLSFPAGTPR